MIGILKTYDEFLQYIDTAGFMTLSGNPLGYPNLSELTEPSQWFTNLDNDPWQWKTRIVEERHASYARLFHGLPSFISKQWYPYFLAVRRRMYSFEEAYGMGLMSAEARRIYQLFDNRTRLATHEIKQLGGFTKAKGRYDNAMTALQTGMFLTISGMTRMTAMDGRPHSWPVTEYQRVENWAWEGTFEQAARINRQEAIEKITAKILENVPGADGKKISRFIGV